MLRMSLATFCLHIFFLAGLKHFDPPYIFREYTVSYHQLKEHNTNQDS